MCQTERNIPNPSVIHTYATHSFISISGYNANIDINGLEKIISRFAFIVNKIDIYTSVKYIFHYLYSREKLILFICHLLQIRGLSMFLDTIFLGLTSPRINLDYLRAAFPRTPTRDSVRWCQSVKFLPLLHLLHRLTKRHCHCHRVHLK